VVQGLLTVRQYFNDPDNPRSDTTAVFGPRADYWVRVGAGRLIGQTEVDYFYFREYDTQRSFGTINNLRLEVPLARIVPFATCRPRRRRETSALRPIDR
jgi:hypothetical protein